MVFVIQNAAKPIPVSAEEKNWLKKKGVFYVARIML
jgi:hypothetical protein